MQEGVPKQVENLRNITRTGSPTRSAYVVLMHDIWRSTAEQLADQAITLFQNLGYQLVDMGTCRSGSISGCYQ